MMLVLYETRTAKILSLFCIGILLLSVTSYFPGFVPEAQAKIADKKEINVASWNLWNFSGSFGSGRDTPEVRQTMAQIIKDGNYDIIFVQELRNDGRAFVNMCNEHFSNGYECQITEQITGTGSNNEGYGVIYKDGIDVILEDPGISQGTAAGHMVRPPMKAVITVDEYKFTAYNNHIKPGNPQTRDELQTLQNSIGYTRHNLLAEKNIVVLGDLNADCRYLPGGLDAAVYNNLFGSSEWNRIFTNADRTNFASTACAYDRIIVNKNMDESYSGERGIVGTLPDGTSFGRYPNPGYTVGDPPKHISDHKLIWAKFSYGGVESTDDAGNSKPNFTDYAGTACDNPGTVHARGEGFVPDKDVRLYITTYPGHNAGSAQSYQLSDVAEYDRITTDAKGNIVNTGVWDAPVPGSYNVIVDVNADGYFTDGIDVIDVFDGAGFIVDECESDAGGISGVVFSDTDGNGIRDAGEPGIEGYTMIAIDDKNTNDVRYAETGSDGTYSFDITDHVGVTLVQTGYFPPNHTVVDANSSWFTRVDLRQENQAEFNVGFYPVPPEEHITLNIVAYLDGNSNGVRDPQEHGVAGLEFHPYTYTIGPVGVMVTDESGRATISSLVPADFALLVLDNFAESGYVWHSTSYTRSDPHSGAYNYDIPVVDEPSQGSVHTMELGLVTTG